MQYLINIIRGFCMALADSVPGVSGGTIAFVMGIYDKFINSLDRLIYGKWEEKKEAISFLVKIGIGWIIGMILAILILTNLFESHVYAVSSVFMGLIIVAIPFIIKQEKDVLKGKYKNLIFTIIGLLIVCLITYFNPVSGGETSIDLSNLNIGLVLYVFIAGMIAVSAMVLPGISGSTLLLIFGLYMPIMSAIKEILHLSFSSLPIVIVFGLGVIAGVLCTIRLIKIALEKFRSQTIYCIIGLMLGSIYAIIMGPTTLDTPQDPMTFGTFSIIFFIIGVVIIIGLEKLKNIFEKRQSENK